jgi:hypothetical protein
MGNKMIASQTLPDEEKPSRFFRLIIFKKYDHPLSDFKEHLTGEDALNEGTLAIKNLLEGEIGGFTLVEEVHKQ